MVTYIQIHNIKDNKHLKKKYVLWNLLAILKKFNGLYILHLISCYMTKSNFLFLFNKALEK